MIKIPLSKNGKNAGLYEAIIDDCDSDLAELVWSCSVKRTSLIYAFRRINGVRKTLHRIIMERIIGRSLLRGEQVDHINRNTLDNRRNNLRIATHTENMRNRGSFRNNKSGLKGVYWDKETNLWRAGIRKNGKVHYLGRFEDKYDAYAAYCEAAKELHGEFANLSNNTDN